VSNSILEMSEYPVRRLQFGAGFFYKAGVLEIDRAALNELLLEDPRIESADCEIVAPGEPVRITGVRDVVEPRAKLGGEAQVFPGALGPVIAVGAGHTHRLSGVAIMSETTSCRTPWSPGAGSAWRWKCRRGSNAA